MIVAMRRWIYFAILAGLVLFLGGCFVPGDYPDYPSPTPSPPSLPYTPGDLVLVQYQPDVLRVGVVEDCTQDNVIVRFFRNTHERRIPRYRCAYPIVEGPLNEAQRNKILSIPDWYYTLDWFPAYPQTLRGLEDFLLGFSQYADQYKRNIYDCSEASAYLEACLEDAGYDARIIGGPAPFAPEGKHAWVHVLLPDYIVAIEATLFFKDTLREIWDRIHYLFTGRVPGIIYADHPYAHAYYYEYDYNWYDIYTAVAVINIYEMDWWNLEF